MSTFINKVAEISAGLRELPGWTDEAKKVLSQHMDAVFYRGAVAIWLPEVRRIGGVYNVTPDKDNPVAVPYECNMPSVNLGSVAEVRHYNAATFPVRMLQNTLKAGILTAALFTAPLYVAAIYLGARIALPPTAIYAFQAKEDFFEGAHLSKGMTPAYLMLSEVSVEKNSKFWRHWVRSHK